MARPQSARRQAEGEEQWPLDQPFRFRRRTSTSRATPSPRPGRPTRRWLARLPFGDVADFEAARRGLIAPVPEGMVRTASGTVLWNLGEYAFIDGELAPATVNPSLWRMARLNLANGLFKVTDRLYQLRGFDIANMTVIEGDSGLILIDPLTTAEVARAALAHYYAHRPKRPVVAVIYTHSHIDHYGGVRGVIDEADVRSGKVAGHRAGRIHGGGVGRERAGRHADGAPRPVPVRLDAAARAARPGRCRAGQGHRARHARPDRADARASCSRSRSTRSTASGSSSSSRPRPRRRPRCTCSIPQLGVLNMAENACPLLHNFIPLRGAVARDPRIWAKYIGDAIALYGAGHRDPDRPASLADLGPGRRCSTISRAQRDLYKHIHDQTLRYMNKGWRPAEIAEAIDLPPGLAERWSVRGYYGIGQPQREGGLPALSQLVRRQPLQSPSAAAGPGGAQVRRVHGRRGRGRSRARKADFARGEYRWVAQVMKEVVYAEPDNIEARALCADALEQMGYQAESATWRNAFLYGAQELRHGVFQLPARVGHGRRHAGRAHQRHVLRHDGDPPRSGEGGRPVDGASTGISPTATRSSCSPSATARSAIAWASGRTRRPPRSPWRAPRSTRSCWASSPRREALASGALEIDGDRSRFAALFAMLDQPAGLMFDILTPGEGRP